MDTQFQTARIQEIIEAGAEELLKEFPEMSREEIEADLYAAFIAGMKEEETDLNS